MLDSPLLCFRDTPRGCRTSPQCREARRTVFSYQHYLSTRHDKAILGRGSLSSSTTSKTALSVGSSWTREGSKRGRRGYFVDKSLSDYRRLSVDRFAQHGRSHPMKHGRQLCQLGVRPLCYVLIEVSLHRGPECPASGPVGRYSLVSRPTTLQVWHCGVLI